MMPGALAMVILCLALWVFAYRTLVRHPLDYAAVTLYLTGYQMIWRPFVVAIGWDNPFPLSLYRSRDEEAIIMAGQRMVMVWLIALTIGYVLGRTMTPSPPSPTAETPLELHVTVLSRLMIVFTVVSTVITLWLWARFGGFSGLISANKLDKALIDLQWLRSFAVLSTFVAGATYLAAVASGRRTLSSIALAISLLNGAYSFSWGARDAIAITTFGLLAGRLLFNRKEVGAAAILPSSALAWWRRRRRVLRLALTVLLLVSSVFFLRVTRDALIFGETLGSIESQEPARQLAVSTNNTSFDTMALLVEDWPERQEFIGGEQFYIGALSFLPGFLYLPEDGFRPPAIQVAQYYIPSRQNGWPMTPIGDWYMSWGLLGVVAGGALSGIVVRVLQVRLENFSRNPLVWMLSIVLAFRVLPMGLWANSIPRLMTFALPASIVLYYVQRRRPERAKARVENAADRAPYATPPDGLGGPVEPRDTGALATVAMRVREARSHRVVSTGSSVEIVRRTSPRPGPPDGAPTGQQGASEP
ncbi:MAG: hypothetical protein OES57_09795 [Acidimicrobiia bacterium]|nr:hypothetical protein [Acidimicrobiia bacterium]